jgi:hypothetical protein
MPGRRPDYRSDNIGKMNVKYLQIRISGKTIKVPSVRIQERTIVVTGKWLKMATVNDEELVEGDVIDNPQVFVSELKTAPVRADIFTFPQTIYGAMPSQQYPFEWDNAAVASTTNFTDWWKKLPQEARKNARRAVKRGVSVRVAKFDDELIRGIKGIYDETPMRQGMHFWHFGKDFETVKMENGTYLERSEFIGAYLDGELIGFIKFVYVDRTAKIMQILSKTQHYDKRPMNALIAKAVEVCHEKGMSYLVYSKFTFGNKKTSQLTEFKRRNGFEQMNFVRYYVPLTLKGKIALKLKLHRGLLGILPSGLIDFLLRLRSRFIQVTPKALARRVGITSGNEQGAIVPANSAES